MEELTNEQWMEKNPLLRKLADYILFTNREEVDLLRTSEKITIGSEEVSIEFLKRILNDDFYYEYASRYFNGDIDTFKVSFIIGGDSGYSVYYKRSTIIKGIEQLIESGQIELDDERKQKYEYLKNKISFEKFIEKNKGNNYNLDIEGSSYSIPIQWLVSLMQVSNAQFDDLCINSDIKDINGIPKEYVVYASLKFFENSHVFDEYLVPNNVVERYKEIKSFQKIDIQAINKHLTTVDTKYKEVQIDSSLEQAILSNLPEDATTLEKAIYIYIKMCKLLTYDEEFYAVNQKGEAAKKHESLDHVSTITLDNNKVVCFEFNMIYAKLLNNLGINFASGYGKNALGMDNPYGEDSYGSGHANMEFRVGKFLVSADSVTSILQGDIMQAKLNQPLVGLKCVNMNRQTQMEFSEALTKIYQLIAKQENNKIEDTQVEHIQTLDEILEEYSQVTDNIQSISLNERLSILVDKVISTGMIGIDSLSYVLQLRRILFTQEQRNNNISVSIVRSNESNEEGKVASAIAVFALNGQSFKDFPGQSNYYYFDSNHGFVQVTQEELQNRFNNSVLEYIEKDDPRIPGISEDGGLKI